MELFSGVGAAGALLKNATSLVQALKQPKITDETFSEMLKSQIEAASSPEARQAKAADASERFMRLRDADGDGVLRFEESGLERAVFDKIDRNGDGRLSKEEYQQALMGQSGASNQ